MINEHATQGQSVQALCALYEVSDSGYYDWLEREPSKREQANDKLGREIEAIHKDSQATYGSPRITDELKNRKIKAGKNRVARIMKKKGLKGVQSAAYRPRTTDSNHDLPISPNLLADIDCTDIDQVIVGDITYIPTEEGWEYLAAFMDLDSRMIKGWYMRDHMRTELVENAFRQVAFRHGLPVGIIVHTDRGSQYASRRFRDLLKANKAISSMSGKGNCYDNAAMESFWATLKKDLRITKPFKTREEARRTIFKYIEVFYNRFRIHSALGGLSPWKYEQKKRDKEAA
jgi:transposase InsO family protein